jgi:hypothetical protein
MAQAIFQKVKIKDMKDRRLMGADLVDGNSMSGTSS